MAWSEEQLGTFLNREKIRMAPLWAAAIVARNDQRAIPGTVRDLLQRIDQRLNVTSPTTALR